MGNFYKDNEDLRFYIERGLDWEPLAALTEYGFKGPDGFKNAREAVEFYADVLNLMGEFAADEVAPFAGELDREGVHFEKGEAVFPPRLAKIFESMRGLELPGLCVPRELGGQNAPILLYFVCSELLARADASVMAHYSFHVGIAAAMLVFSVWEGSTTFDAERGRITSTRFGVAIDEIRRGVAWGSMDITEPDAGSDMAALRSVGEQLPDGSWVVSGQKIFITSGHGKYHFVIARTEKASASNDPMAGLQGLSLFLVKAFDDGPEGRTRYATLDRLEEKLGHHASATCALTFDRAPAELVGERGEGFKYMLLLMNNARVGVGFESLGVCQAAYELAAAYAAERRSMGKTLDRHEMIADYLDEMRTDLQGVRALAMASAYAEEVSRKLEIALRHGMAVDGERSERERERESKRLRQRSRRLTPLLKYLAAEKAVEMSRRAVQILGGVGYMREYGAEKLLRDAMVMPIYEGTSQIQALMVMKDTLGGIIKNPQGFLKALAQARWRSLSARDGLERRVARLQTASLASQQTLLTRTAAARVRALQGEPVSSWGKMLREWNPKRDFAFALLHAERLTRILADEAIAEVLWEQARRHPERREVLERHLERAEPRVRGLQEEIAHIGPRILAELEQREEESGKATG